jgi:hypothetical protein
MNSQIADLHDKAAILKIVYPQVAALKVKLSGYVYQGLGKFDDFTLNFMKPVQKSPERILLESKGQASTYIREPDQFSNLPDTLLLLDTLKLSIGFDNDEFPSSAYYINWSAGKSPVVKIGLPLNKQRQIELFRSGLVNTGFYLDVELHNSGSPHRILYSGKVYFLSTPQLAELLEVADSFLKGDAGFDKAALHQALYHYLSAQYPAPLDQQLDQWINKHFPNLK